MKRLTLLTCLFLLTLALPSFSQKMNSDEAALKVINLIHDDLEDNYAAIKETSKSLTETQKMYIYGEEKKSAGLAFVLNLLLGYGIGSWVQGHTAGGLIGTFGNLGGMVMMMSGDDDMVFTGAMIFLTTWVVDLILPFTYKSSYNKTLKKALNMYQVSGLNVAPNLMLSHDGKIIPGLGLQVCF